MRNGVRHSRVMDPSTGRAKFNGGMSDDAVLPSCSCYIKSNAKIAEI